MRPDLAVLLALVVAAVLSMPVYAARRGRSPDPHDAPGRGTFVLGPFVREWFYWFLRPVERASLALGLSPLAYNLLGVAFGVAAGVAFAFDRPVLGGWGVLLGGVADILDGRVARAQGVASRRGAFLDSTLDRFAEMGAFVGLAAWSAAWPPGVLLVASALGGSLLVSYARARGESVGVTCKLGVMQRAERLLLLGFAGLLDPAVSDAAGVVAWTPPGTRGGALLVPAVAVIAAGTVGTAVFRTVWIARRLPHPDPSSEPSSGASSGST